ncbi:hypothetical protein Zmor_016144 [Zophobas morio]|uniref:Uncharacterized protein n=1 Tax=Zophobas morio TaxID=2755281 RepID=A0AA38INE0_9CUCU|nr:hypothetical protein Zmor_016144 [Zophobas morio]
MDTDDIVPSILPEVPPTKITITYPNNKPVDLGTALTPHEVRLSPEVQWEADPQKYYTLYMFDPDAPSRSCPIAADVNHWLVGNIKGCDLSTGDVIAEYRGAGPPRGTGPHRYVFLVFEHEDRVSFGGQMTGMMQRLRFSTKKFREKYKFEKVFAWNYFKAQWSRDPNQESKMCVCM